MKTQRIPPPHSASLSSAYSVALNSAFCDLQQRRPCCHFLPLIRGHLTRRPAPPPPPPLPHPPPFLFPLSSALTLLPTNGPFRQHFGFGHLGTDGGSGGQRMSAVLEGSKAGRRQEAGTDEGAENARPIRAGMEVGRCQA